ncbi:GNAT family N-acetyltransferase [Alterinioella nitratireducens]|uniref:GNAT family N-acetyltransferase n=1 Tax=Alterinioella nitratireducens TaxID=2735915 RepID=UPI001F45CF84|nr:GNAT family N-acetyltransferase [Alterinioella nitratireducens]
MAPRDISQDLTVHLLRSLSEVEDLRADWTELHRRDPQAGLFLSWDWMMRGFRDNPGRFTVLVARADAVSDQVVAILPLKSRVHWSRSKSEFQTQYQAAGRLIGGEYTGFICDPDWEEVALPALAQTLDQMPWTTLSLRYVDQIDRIKAFRAGFARAEYSTRFRPYLINKGETDNLVSPQVTLPDSFDAFLNEGLSANSRQKFRRLERKHLNTGELHLTDTGAETFDAHLEILLEFWGRKWIPKKGAATAAKAADMYRRTLRAGLETDTLFLPVLWRGDTPLGALGHILDHEQKTVHFIVAGRDVDADVPFAGQILHLGSIEWAIAHGYRVYDFCHGNEPYKYSYGTTDKETRYLTVQRREALGARAFDRDNTPEALLRVQDQIKAKKYDLAMRACAQLIASFSDEAGGAEAS